MTIQIKDKMNISRLKKLFRAFSLLVLIIVFTSACGFLGKSSSTSGLVAPDTNLVNYELPVYDPEADLQSPGAQVLRTLEETDPSLADFVNSVEASERAAMSTLISDIQSEYGAGKTKDTSSTAKFGLMGYTRPKIVKSFKNAALVPVDYKLQVAAGESEGPGNAGVILSLLSSMLGDMVSSSLPTGAEISKSATETKDGSTTTMSVEMGRNSDGTTKFGMGMKTESLENGKSVKVEFNTKMDGQRCPNAEGQVSFTVKTTIGVDSGGSAYTQDLTAFVRAVVGEDAQIASTTVDVMQGTQSTKDGRSVYLETGGTYKHKGEDIASSTESNFRVNQATDNVNRSDQKLSDDGLTAALVMGEVSLTMAKNKWLNGACTRIEANSPGKVEISSTTEIPVTVIHRFDGSVVSSKLEAALSGLESVAPTSLAKTPGNLKYTAPDKAGQKATIVLTATSRRGKAKLELSANTGGLAYHISGTIDDASMAGDVCDVSKPFTIGGTLLFSFTPTSENSGTYTYTGPFEAVGEGPYTINDNGSMHISGSGCIMGSNCKTYDHTWSATPIDPSACSDQ